MFACVLENTDVLVRYLCGAGVVDWTSSKEELATFLAWHDIPHPSHLSHISYQQGLYFEMSLMFIDNESRSENVGNMILTFVRGEQLELLF